MGIRTSADSGGNSWFPHHSSRVTDITVPHVDPLGKIVSNPVHDTKDSPCADAISTGWWESAVQCWTKDHILRENDVTK